MARHARFAPLLLVFFVAWAWLSGGSFAASPAKGQPSTPLREAMLRLYVHGVSEALAAEIVREGDLPELRRLLADPDFPRRDNVVAFLCQRDGDAAVEPLLAFLRQPPGDLSRPEEDRAILMAPQAFGYLARRGSRLALSTLLAFTDNGSGGGVLAQAAAHSLQPASLLTDLEEQALFALAVSGASAAKVRLEAIGARGVTLGGGGTTRDLAAHARDVLAHYQELATPVKAERLQERTHTESSTGAAGAPGSEGGRTDGELSHYEPEPLAPENIDNQTQAHRISLAWANHPAVTSPMTATRLKDVLRGATLKVGREDFTDDTGCCIDFKLSGSAQTFGTNGDGLDLIDNSTELSTVLNLPVSRVKVVRAINFCGSSIPGIIGCAWQPGFGMAVVRFGSADDEGALWAHEFGHNTGLPHNMTDNRAIMYPSLQTASLLSQAECNSYHFPLSAAQITPPVIGTCGDPDNDAIASGADNCPAVANQNQADQDGDGLGDVCDPCPTIIVCDSDGDGVFDDVDNCIGLSNPNQLNQDGDAYGDACDVCIYDPYNDVDQDNLCIPNDNCPLAENPGQENVDGDAFGDYCDACPLDALNDADGDGLCANVDNCPSLANPAQTDYDNDGIGNSCDADIDGDAAPNATDNCPIDANFGQSDRDDDGIGDLCDGILTVDDDGPAQFTQIQAAINAASSGDIVFVAPGTYVENLVMKSGVDLVGAGALLATVDGSSALNQPVVAIDDLADGVRVTGFTLQGAVFLGGSLGGGVRVLRSHAEIDGNIIKNNGAFMGGGIYLEGDGSFVQNFAPVITNNLIQGNESGTEGGGVAVYYGGPGWTFRHNTIVENHAGWTSGGMFLALSDGMEVANTIIASNSGDQAAPGAGVMLYSSSGVSFLNNDLFGNPGGDFEPPGSNPTGQNGNVAVSPGFVSPGTGDFSLSAGSALIDAATLAVAPPFDLFHAPRPLSAPGILPPRADIGALERVPSDADGDGVPNATDKCPYVADPAQADSDADGVGNACDRCPGTAVGGQRDVDGDGIGDACDNCPVTANPDQADTNADGLGNACIGPDADADGVGDGNDCAPGNPLAYYLPAEATAVALAGKNPTTVTWTLPAAGTGTTYDVVTGLVAELRADNGFTHAACLVGHTGSLSYADSRPSPASGSVYYYLVRGANACGRGTYGDSSLIPDARQALDAPGTVPCP